MSQTLSLLTIEVHEFQYLLAKITIAFQEFQHLLIKTTIQLNEFQHLPKNITPIAYILMRTSSKELSSEAIN